MTEKDIASQMIVNPLDPVVRLYVDEVDGKDVYHLEVVLKIEASAFRANPAEMLRQPKLDNSAKDLHQKKNASVVNASLTGREKEVIRLICAGKSTAEIAALLFLSLLTIETHRKNIYTKLGMNKIASLVRYAINEGLLE